MPRTANCRKSGRSPAPLKRRTTAFTDALLVGSMLNTPLLSHADVVKVACLAQLVNAGPHYDRAGRPRMGTGDLLAVPLRLSVRPARPCSRRSRSRPTPAVSARGPCLSSSAVLSEDGAHVTVFAVNKSLDES